MMPSIASQTHRIRWTVKHYDGRSEILHRETAEAGWKLKVAVYSHPGSPAQPLGDFFVACLNAAAQSDDLVEETRMLLDTILSDGLDFSTEQSAERLLARLAAAQEVPSCA